MSEPETGKVVVDAPTTAATAPTDSTQPAAAGGEVVQGVNAPPISEQAKPAEPEPIKPAETDLAKPADMTAPPPANGQPSAAAPSLLQEPPFSQPASATATASPETVITPFAAEHQPAPVQEEAKQQAETSAQQQPAPPVAGECHALNALVALQLSDLDTVYMCATSAAYFQHTPHHVICKLPHFSHFELKLNPLR